MESPLLFATGKRGRLPQYTFSISSCRVYHHSGSLLLRTIILVEFRSHFFSEKGKCWLVRVWEQQRPDLSRMLLSMLSIGSFLSEPPPSPLVPCWISSRSIPASIMSNRPSLRQKSGGLMGTKESNLLNRLYVPRAYLGPKRLYVVRKSTRTLHTVGFFDFLTIFNFGFWILMTITSGVKSIVGVSRDDRRAIKVVC
jgi:hypothetical protein